MNGIGLTDKQFGEQYFSNFDSEGNVFLDPEDAWAESGFADVWDNIIQPYDRTIVFRIANTNAFSATAVLFDAFRDVGQPAGVLVTQITGLSGAVGQQFIRQVTKDNPILFWGLKMLATDTSQLANPFSILRFTASGSFSGGLYHPINYTNPTNFQSNDIDDPTFRLAVDGYTSIRVPLNAFATATLTFTVKARRNVLLTAKGIKDDLQIASAPRPSGNTNADTQIQLLKLRSKAWGEPKLIE